MVEQNSCSSKYDLTNNEDLLKGDFQQIATLTRGTPQNTILEGQVNKVNFKLNYQKLKRLPVSSPKLYKLIA